MSPENETTTTDSTEETTATESTETAAALDATETTPESAGDDDTTGTEQEPATGKAGREAAKYRVRLREAEAERDAIGAQVTEMQRGAIANHLEASKSFKPELLELAGYTPDKFFGDDGKLSPAILAAAVADVSERFGIFTGSMVKYVNLDYDPSAAAGVGTSLDWKSALQKGL